MNKAIEKLIEKRHSAFETLVETLGAEWDTDEIDHTKVDFDELLEAAVELKATSQAIGVLNNALITEEQ